jgi:hypothetical protein
VLAANRRWKFIAELMKSCLVLLLAIAMTSCNRASATIPNVANTSTRPLIMLPADGSLGEVNTPENIAQLSPSFDRFQPQVKILSPQPNETLQDDRVRVELQVNDLPIFKQPDLGLGPHLHLILDKNTYQPVYDLNQPIEFEHLSPGTHTLRVFASRPWHESFKNEGAYAQTTFHVLTPSGENNPDSKLPLLTYSRPVGTYGAEPIMLDFYLTNAPSHFVAQGSGETIADWRVKATVNDQSFILDRWSPIYLSGFRRGKNWVRLELIDDRGHPIANVYNDTIVLVNYDPQLKDGLAKLIQGKIDPNLAQSLVDPNYTAAKPAPVVPTPTRSPVVVPTPTPTPETPPIVVTPTPVPIASPSPTPTPSIAPEITSVPQEIAPSPPPKPAPTPSEPIALPAPTVAPEPAPVVTPSPSPISLPPAAKSIPTPEIVPSPAIKLSTPPPVPSISPIVETPKVAPSIAPSPAPEGVTPPIPAPVAAEADAKTWQTKAIEVLKVAQAKTKEFTNSIPPQAEKFGNKLKIWFNNAIDRVRAMRNAAVESTPPTPSDIPLPSSQTE